MTWILRNHDDQLSQPWCDRPKREDADSSTNGSMSYEAGDGYGDSPGSGAHNHGDIDDIESGWGCDPTYGFQREDGSGSTMRPLRD